MQDMIKEKLDALGCTAYTLVEEESRGWEFYFIGHKLDQHRATDVHNTTVTVYRSLEDGKMLGQATGVIFPTATEEEIDKTLQDLMYQATLVKNPFYTLNDKPLPPRKEKPAVDLQAMAEAFIDLMNDLPETEEKYLNSYEIFVKEYKVRFRNSCGIDFTEVVPKATLEYVVNAKKESHEIELYRIGNSGDCDKEGLRKEIERVLNFAKDRLEAVNTPEGLEIPVLLSTGDSRGVYDYFLDKTGAAMKYMKMSDWEVGKPVADHFDGDRVTMEVVHELPYSSANFEVDQEGAYIQERCLIREGIMENSWGSRQYSCYLGLEDSSLVYNIVVSGGSRTEEEIRREDYLEVVEFSDFQVDSMGGDIAGEIRLGYLHQGGKTTIVTGGSVSGNMISAASQMDFSKETVLYDRCRIPSVTRLKGLRITGVKTE